MVMVNRDQFMVYNKSSFAKLNEQQNNCLIKKKIVKKLEITVERVIAN